MICQPCFICITFWYFTR